MAIRYPASPTPTIYNNMNVTVVDSIENVKLAKHRPGDLLVDKINCKTYFVASYSEICEMMTTISSNPGPETFTIDTTVECPSCGAHKFTQNGNTCICEYCGSTFPIHTK